MSEDIIPYLEMCRREGTSLQQGINYRLGANYSVILMSTRRNAPYQDRLEDRGTTLVYEGHNERRSPTHSNPKVIEQPEKYASGALTQNGKFNTAAQDFKAERRRPERVRVYEKIHSGIWAYNGFFHLVDSWRELDGYRSVFKFRLIAVEGDENLDILPPIDLVRRRIVPTAVKLEVWKRDGGRCVLCGASDELHFDHDLPWSKGGTSITAANVQILCARHNLGKHNKII